MRAKRVVQTEVEPSVHARLEQIASKRSLPLKAVVREALLAYAARAEGELGSDPAFDLIGCWDLKGANWSTRKDWRP
jgi:hypothetical protein